MFMKVASRSILVLFFFKQKTAYEMRISDWSSDVCSSDLLTLFIATHVSIRTSDTSTTHYQVASSAYGTLRYRVIVNDHTLSFGAYLEPRYIFAAGSLI